jgi:hypothetical protein
MESGQTLEAVAEAVGVATCEGLRFGTRGSRDTCHHRR